MQVTPIYNYSPQTRYETLLQLIYYDAGKNVFVSGNFSYFVFKEDKGNNIVVHHKLCMKTLAFAGATSGEIIMLVKIECLLVI